MDHACETTDETESTVVEVMLRDPKTLPVHASIADARPALGNDHVHMLLLTEGRTLVGTLTRNDLPPTGIAGPAVPWPTLVGRTVPPHAPAAAVQDLMVDRGIRRGAGGLPGQPR